MGARGDSPIGREASSGHRFGTTIAQPIGEAMNPSNKQRSLGFRSPFVVTVAALVGAVATACGGSVTDTGAGRSGGTSAGAGGTGGAGGDALPAGYGGDAGYGGNPPNPTCGAVGTSCAIEGQMCRVEERAAATPFARVAPGSRRSRRAFHRSKTCPTTQPTIGVGCNVDPNLSCPYVTSYCCGTASGTALYSCVNNAWSSMGGSGSNCNTPAVACPVEPPRPGEGCGDNCSDFGYCQYMTSCGANTYFCSRQIWQKQSGCDAGADTDAIADAPIVMDAGPAQDGGGARRLTRCLRAGGASRLPRRAPNHRSRQYHPRQSRPLGLQPQGKARQTQGFGYRSFRKLQTATPKRVCSLTFLQAPTTN